MWSRLVVDLVRAIGEQRAPGVRIAQEAVKSLRSGGRVMRRSERAALWCFIVLAAVALAATLLYLSGWATIIKDVVVLGGRGAAMADLAKRTPFTPPPGAGVSEERLRAYLEVSGRVKPFGDKIDEWEAEHAQGVARGGPSFKGRAAGLVEAYLREFGAALEDQRMGPTEFAWIGDRMRKAADGTPASDAASESDRVLHGKYRKSLEASALGIHALRIARDFASTPSSRRR
jgi:hypothetical protein